MAIINAKTNISFLVMHKQALQLFKGLKKEAQEEATTCMKDPEVKVCHSCLMHL
jgi:hypothetical protein